MQALVMKAFFELVLAELPIPRIERSDDVLIEIKTAGVCGSDLHGYTGQSGRRTPPVVMGHEATGRVVETGTGVNDLPHGTRVAIHPIDDSRGERRLLGKDAPGAFAQYVVWPARNLVPLPDAVTFEHGALVEPLAVAVRAVNRAGPGGAASAVVVGAGTIGLLVASVLKHRGVATVVISDPSPERRGVASNIGVDVAVDPRQIDIAEVVLDLTDGRGADVAFEAVGIAATVAQAHAVVKDGGTVVWIGNNVRLIDVDMQQVVTRELAVLGTYAMSGDDFVDALGLLEAGAIDVANLINRWATLPEGPALFDELLASPSIVKCLFRFE
jgi:L-iditol 2-dehydrogenase